jgi:L-ascorbate metabolism protein UlaG (beta-lactamase superfamily)
VRTLLLFLAACGAAPAGSRLSPSPSPSSSPVSASGPPPTLTYLGAAGWRLDRGEVTVLVDPFLSRPDLAAPLVSDPAAIAAGPARAAAILVGHSHADHVLDVPAIARRTGAEVLGSESTARYARASGVAADHVITVRGGEDLEFGAFSVRVIPSLHSALDHKHTYGASAQIPENVTLPLTFAGFAEGGTYAYLVRLGGRQILFLSTANFIERELEGIHPDVAVVATGLREELHDYSCRLMRVLGAPPLVITSHFDDWRHPPKPSRELDADTAADLAAFAAEIHACAPRTRVVVPDPGVAIAVPGR